MAKRFILLAMFGLWSNFTALACDACGCNIGSNSLGLLTAYKNNFIGLGWQMASFHAIPEHGNANDDFHIIDLSIRYHLSERMKVLLHQPYRINVRENEGVTDGLNGISDTRILGSYTILKNRKINKNATLFLEMGGGVKLPTGKYDANLHQTNLPENFNLGNGSWGYLAQTNMVFNYKKVGFVFGGNYQHNGRTSSGYQFGHQLTIQSMVFWEHKLTKSIKLIPNAGVFSEWVTNDKYANNNTVTGTGGNGTFASVAVNLQQNDYLLGFSYAHPLAENYSDGEVQAKGRLNVQLSFIF